MADDTREQTTEQKKEFKKQILCEYYTRLNAAQKNRFVRGFGAIRNLDGPEMIRALKWFHREIPSVNHRGQ